MFSYSCHSNSISSNTQEINRLTPKKSPIKVTEITTSKQTTEKGVSTGCNRKIAQLVVWTKKCGKQVVSKKGDQENKKPQASEQSFRSLACGPTKDLEPEGDLFFVQYPVRLSNETSTNKLKVPKRQRKVSPQNPGVEEIPCLKRRKKSHKTKRFKNPSSEGSCSSGRAFRTYLHSCLENQRQNPSCAGPSNGPEPVGSAPSDLTVDAQNDKKETLIPTSDNSQKNFFSIAKDNELSLSKAIVKEDSISNVSFPHDDILATACAQAQLISVDDLQQQQHRQDLTSSDQVIPMSSYEMTESATNESSAGLLVNVADLYESKELRISNTNQQETNEDDLFVSLVCKLVSL